MRYQIKQKIWSFGDSFVIRDAAGQPALLVEGRVFSWGDSLSIKDPGGQERARIEQTMLSLKPRYRITGPGGQLFAEVVKEWSWFRKSFTLDVPGPNDYAVTGSFWDHEYTFERGGRAVARVSKAFWSWSDTYGVDIVEGEDAFTILTTCVVIDLICHDGDEG